MVEELGRAVAPGPVRAHRHRQRRARRGRRRRRRSRCLPGLADGSAHRRRRPRRLGHGRPAAPRRARPASCSAAGWPSCCSSPPATTSLVVEVGDGVTVDDARRTSTRPAARARVTLDGAAGHGAARRPPGPRRPRPRDPRRPRPSASPASAPSMAAAYAKERVQFGRADRHVPGGQAPLRQHGRGHRAGHHRRVGRGPGRRHRRRPAHLRRRGRRHPRRARPPTCAPTSTPRCTAASPSPGSTTPTCTCAGPPRC